MAMPPHGARIAMCAWLVGYQPKSPGRMRLLGKQADLGRVSPTVPLFKLYLICHQLAVS